MMTREQSITGPAATARIEQVATADAKAESRAAWALGDYHAFAKQFVWEVGPVLVEACRVRPGQRLLDVAAGTGNVALRAALAGADVVASDLTSANFDSGRREADALGVELDWVEADAESLPFAYGEFDVVTSCFGAMFAPDHRAVADELVRVCRPGGTIGMVSFTPDGLGAEFFTLFAPYLPSPPPGALSPVLWGSDAHVRELFGERLESLEARRCSYIERASTPGEYCEFVKATFGPVIGIYASLADQPDRVTELDRSFLEFVLGANQGPVGGPVELSYEYLLVVARTKAASGAGLV